MSGAACRNLDLLALCASAGAIGTAVSPWGCQAGWLLPQPWPWPDPARPERCCCPAAWVWPPWPSQVAQIGVGAGALASLQTLAINGVLEDGAGGTRTHDLRFRKPSLYPAELQPPSGPALGTVRMGIMGFESRRGGRDRGRCGLQGGSGARLRKVRAPQWPGLLGNAQCG